MIITIWYSGSQNKLKFVATYCECSNILVSYCPMFYTSDLTSFFRPENLKRKLSVCSGNSRIASGGFSTWFDRKVSCKEEDFKGVVALISSRSRVCRLREAWLF